MGECICAAAMKTELERYQRDEDEPEHRHPIKFVTSGEFFGVVLWCAKCGRLATMTGAYFDKFDIVVPELTKEQEC